MAKDPFGPRCIQPVQRYSLLGIPSAISLTLHSIDARVGVIQQRVKVPSRCQGMTRMNDPRDEFFHKGMYAAALIPHARLK
eukprot:5372711-Pyramimonas_sp.AAC.1